MEAANLAAKPYKKRTTYSSPPPPPSPFEFDAVLQRSRALLDECENKHDVPNALPDDLFFQGFVQL